MILACSPRIFEHRTGYDLGFEELVALLAQIGYDALEVRRRQLDERSSPADIARTRKVLAQSRMRCAFLTAAGLEDRQALDDATRVLAVALALECHLVRVQLVRPAEIPLAQELADRAAARGLRLMSQIHSGTLFANLESALEALAKIGRANFGVAFEPSHLMFEGQAEHGEGAVRQLGAHIFACFLQAYKPAPEGSESLEAIDIHGRRWLPALPGEQGSADIASVLRGLRAIGFDGLICVTPPRHPQVESRNLARIWHDYVRKVWDKVGVG